MKTLSLQKLGLIMLMSLIFFSASAYDFEVDGLCYNILSNNKKTVTLTCKVDDPANENYVLGDLTIPQSVEYSGNIYAVTEIGDKSFYYCKGLTSVNIPSTITNIGRYAFYNCSGLTSVTIPNSVINIYEAAFRECSGLMSITLGNSINLIGYGAFCLCTSLTSIEIPNSVYYLDQIAFASCTKLTSVSIGDSVSYIGQSAFYNCSALTYITFGNSVTTIGEYAFDGCIGLTSITIPSPIETIEREAFRNCTGLTSVYIGNSVTKIGWWAFRGCTGLTSVTIPDSVSIIESPIFPSCKNLLSINVSENNENYCSLEGILYSKDFKILEECPDGKGGVVDIPDAVTTIGGLAFGDCSELISIIIPNSVINIGWNAFEYCKGLTTVNIPNSVISLGDYVFYQCSNLASVTIGNSVETIGLGAFSGCYSLSKIYCAPETPPSVYYNPFDYSEFNNVHLYVPVGSKGMYQQVDPWRNFKNIEEFDFSSVVTVYDEKMTICVQDNIVTVAGVSEDALVVIFDMNGCAVVNARGNFSANLPNGVYVLRSVGKTVKFKI